MCFASRSPRCDPAAVLTTLTNSTFSAFLVGQQAAKAMLSLEGRDGHKGTIVFTNASAALKGYPRSAAFAAASHGKAGLAQSMARELMPQGIHVAHVPIDAAIGWEQPDGSRAHRLAGEAVDDNLAHPDRIAELYWQLHRQHRSTWAYRGGAAPLERELVDLLGRRTLHGSDHSIAIRAGLHRVGLRSRCSPTHA